MLKIQLNLFLSTQNLFIGSIQIISGPSVGSVQLVVNVRLIWAFMGVRVKPSWLVMAQLYNFLVTPLQGHAQVRHGA
jgi:hypothetical protein